MSSESPADDPAPVARPGEVTFAVVLGCVYAGITLVLTFGYAVMLGPRELAEPMHIVAWIVVVIQIASALMLVEGGSRLGWGQSRSAYVTGAATALPVCAYYVYLMATVDGGRSALGKSVADMINNLAYVPAALAGLPLAGLILAFGPKATAYLKA